MQSGRINFIGRNISTSQPGKMRVQKWPLNDNAANNTVTGTVAGTLTGGNTQDVHAIVDGHSAFHLDGATQYVTIKLADTIKSNEMASLWTKQENAVLGNKPSTQLCKIPTGGWYLYSIITNDAVRWTTVDLINFSDQLTVLLGGGVGAWDEVLDGALVFQKPSGDWLMLYRGHRGGTSDYKTGLATSVDGAVFTRKDNGGVDDGLFPQFGTNYDPFAVILVGTTYYVYVNGYPDHGHLCIYYSTDDCATFTAYNGGEPIFNNGFCPYVFKYSGYYYIILSRDLNAAGSALGDHGLALYRSLVPTFDYDNREFLGYVIVNDQAYDDRYLDTPTMPFTDVYRDTYTTDFGDTLNMIYAAELSGGYARATSTFADLVARPTIPEIYQESYCRMARTYSFWVQFDSLTAGDVVFSVGYAVNDGSEVQFMSVQGTAPKYLTLYYYGTGYFYRNIMAIDIDTPYHVIVVDAVGDTKVYIDNVLKATFTPKGYMTDALNLYIGNGYDGTKPLDGYIWDFRIYDHALSASQVDHIYNGG